MRHSSGASRAVNQTKTTKSGRSSPLNSVVAPGLICHCTFGAPCPVVFTAIAIFRPPALHCQEIAVPARIFRDFVVGNRECTPLRFRQALYLEDRDLPKSQQLCRGIAAVTRNDDPALVDHDRNHKSERRDAVGDLADLLLRVRPCIPRIRLERVNCETFYLGHEALLLTPKAKRAR